MRKILFLVCVLGLSCVSLAQSKTDWSSLTSLRAGQKIQIVDTQSKKHSGTFVSGSDTSISYRDTVGEHSIEKQEIRTVTIMENKHRLRNTLIVDCGRCWRWEPQSAQRPTNPARLNLSVLIPEAEPCQPVSVQWSAEWEAQLSVSCFPPTARSTT